MEISSGPSHGQEEAKNINHFFCSVIGFADSETEAVALVSVGRVSCGFHYIFCKQGRYIAPALLIMHPVKEVTLVCVFPLSGLLHLCMLTNPLFSIAV